MNSGNQTETRRANWKYVGEIALVAAYIGAAAVSVSVTAMQVAKILILNVESVAVTRIAGL